jgi:uncharacterized membrane protein
MRRASVNHLYNGIIVLLSVMASCDKNDSGRIVADFEADHTVAAVNSEISITDLSVSKNEITEWLWDFGDGQTSTEQHPTHTYTSEGNYTIALTARNNYGSAIETKANYIDVVGPVLTDVEGNEYQTVIIGNQAWMAENLRTTKYKNGSDIPQVEGDNLWIDREEPAYCWYNNNTADAITAKYGAMYNFHTVNTGNLCPTGWHIPNQDEWHELFYYLATNGFN